MQKQGSKAVLFELQFQIPGIESIPLKHLGS